MEISQRVPNLARFWGCIPGFINSCEARYQKRLVGQHLYSCKVECRLVFYWPIHMESLVLPSARSAWPPRSSSTSCQVLPSRCHIKSRQRLHVCTSAKWRHAHGRLVAPAFLPGVALLLLTVRGGRPIHSRVGAGRGRERHVPGLRSVVRSRP